MCRYFITVTTMFAKTSEQRAPHYLHMAVGVLLASVLLLAIALARAPHRQLQDTLFVSDGFGYYIYLPSMVIDGDLDLTNQIEHQPGQLNHWTFAETSQTGKPGNIFQVGSAVLWLPFFLLTHAVLTCLNAFGLQVPQDGFGWAYELPVYCGSFFYGLIGIWYMWRLLRDLWGPRIATVSTFYIVTATSVAAYLWFQPDMSHIGSMTLISMLFFYLHRLQNERQTGLGTWIRVGVLTGVIGLVRAPDLLVGLAIAWVGLNSAVLVPWKSGKPHWPSVLRHAAMFFLAAFVMFIPQLLVWKALYGNFFSMPPNPFYTQIDWMRADVLNYLLSTRHGVFSWTPILLIATAGLVWGAIRGHAMLRYALPVLIAAIYFNSSIHNWWVGCSFGERRLVDYAILFALGLGYLFNAHPALVRRRSVHLVGLGLCAFNWLLILRYFTGDLPEYGDVSWYDLYVKTLQYPFQKLTSL